MYISDAPDLGENKALILHSLCYLFSLRTLIVTLLNEAWYDIEERITMSIESLWTILD